MNLAEAKGKFKDTERFYRFLTDKYPAPIDTLDVFGELIELQANIRLTETRNWESKPEHKENRI